MKMKRNVLALAISSGMVMAPAAAMADGPEIYGLFDVGLEHLTDSDGVTGAGSRDIFSGFNSVAGNSDGKDFTLQNGMSSRLGVRGSEDLGFMGLQASYTLELAVDVLGETGGGFASSVGTRLGWAAIGNDQLGTVKVGSQWMPLYEFGGWNTMRTDTHGYGTYFYTTELLSNSTQFGFRQGSAISYQYGSAWDHSDPFAFNITLGVGEGSSSFTVEEQQNAVAYVDEDGNDVFFDGAGGTTTDPANAATETVESSESASNEEGISSVQVAAQYSFNNQISVNAVYLREFNSYDQGGDTVREDFAGDSLGVRLNDDVELYNVGARYSVTDALEFAANYMLVDTNNDDGDKRDAWTIASFMDFGDGLSGHLGFGQGSDDRDVEDGIAGRDIDLNAYGYVKQALSDRTNVRLELEHLQYDTEDDSKATIAMIGLQHSF